MNTYVAQPEPKAVLFLLLLVAWWLIRHQPEESAPEEDGGSHTQPRHPHRPWPRGRGPRGPRRGPHGDPPAPAPARVRTISLRSRLHGRS